MSVTLSVILAVIGLAAFVSTLRGIKKCLKKINETNDSSGDIRGLHGMIVLMVLSLVLGIYFSVLTFQKLTN